MFHWSMACNDRTWNEEGSTIAARLYMLCDLMPNVPARIVKKIAAREVEVSVDEEAGTVTFTIGGE